MSKVEIDMLEVHVANSCNLFCNGCGHFSNYKLPGVFPAEELRNWSMPWTERILPKEMCLLGGEPLINPECVEILKDHSKLWPSTSIMFFTNGLLLHKWINTDLFRTLVDNDITLVVSNHTTLNSDHYDGKMKDVMAFVKKMHKKFDFKYEISFTAYTKKEAENGTTYIDENLPLDKGSITDVKNAWLDSKEKKGTFSTWMPFKKKPFNTGDPQASWWYTCGRRDMQCWQLYKQEIYPCSILAYLPDLDRKVGLGKEWDFYLQYQPLQPYCSDEDLQKFLIPGPCAQCEMCPKSDYEPQIKEGNPLIYEPFYNDIRQA